MDAARRALIYGSLGRKQRKAARNGTPYLCIDVHENGAVRPRTVYAFHGPVIDEVEALGLGVMVAFAGKWWMGNGREPALIADGVLSVFSRPRQSRRVAEPDEPEAELPLILAATPAKRVSRS